MVHFILLVVIVHLLIIGYLFSISNPKRSFGEVLGMMLVLCLFHSIYKAICYFFISEKPVYEAITPLGLLYGPLLYFLSVTANGRIVYKKEILIHSIPCMLFTLAYAFLLYGVFAHASWSDAILNLYYINYLCLIISLLGYPAYVVLKKYTSLKDLSEEEKLLDQLVLIYFISALFLGFLAFITSDRSPDLGFDPRLLLAGLMLVVIIVILRYFFYSNNYLRSFHTTIEDHKTARYSRCTLSKAVLETYEDKLHHYLQESKLYLRSELSLEVLADHTKIPKHHFSQLFNVHMHKSFYQLVAEYRIKHAIVLLHTSGEKLKIESLAHDCGFSSKTSFNKYFKTYTGYTPSEYRELKIQKMDMIDKSI